MKYFIDTATNKPVELDDSVIVTNNAGVYSFESLPGIPMNLPKTLQPCTQAQAWAILYPPLSQTQLIAQIDSAVDAHLDVAAQRKGYKDAATCISYMNSTVAAWAADAKAMNQWRDDAWNYAVAQEAVTPLPTPAAVTAGIDALASNPKW